jgi:hypothetical protein
MKLTQALLGSAFALSVGTAHAFMTPTPLPPLPAPLADFYPAAAGTLPIAAGETLLLDFTLAGTVTSSSFVSSITPLLGASAPPLSFKLFSGATEVLPTAPPTGVFSSTVSFSGLSIGQVYTIELKSGITGGYAIKSNFVGDAFNATITAVPEPESLALVLAGLGVAGMLARRRPVI